ncbi:MAG: hypothetical protein AB7I08_14740, partial [Thermoleophilia bacterium]
TFFGAVPAGGEGNSSFAGVRILEDGTLGISAFGSCAMGCGFGVQYRFAADGRRVSEYAFPWFSEDGAEAGTGVLPLPDGGVVLGYDATDPAAPVGHRVRVLSPSGTVVRDVALPFTFRPEAIDRRGRIRGLSGRTVARLAADLAPDHSFGTGGRAALPGRFPAVRSVAVGGGRTYVAGRGDASVSLATYDAAGRRTRTAHVDGIVTPEWSTSRVVVRPDRVLVAAGDVVAFRPGGAQDRAFGRGGVLRTALGGDIAVQADGRIVLARLATTPSGRPPTRLLMRRVTALGDPDPSYRRATVRMRVGTYVQISTAVDRRGRTVAVTAGWAPGEGGAVFARFLGR